MDERLELFLVAHVSSLCHRRAAGGGDLGNDHRAALGFAARDHHPCAMQRHLRGDRLADAAAGTGDDGYLAREVEEAHATTPAPRGSRRGVSADHAV